MKLKIPQVIKLQSVGGKGTTGLVQGIQHSWEYSKLSQIIGSVTPVRAQ